MAKPRCFFDITIGGGAAGRIVFEVRTLSFDYPANDSRTHGTFSSSTSVFVVLVRICVTRFSGKCQLIPSFLIYSSEQMLFQRLQVCIKLAQISFVRIFSRIAV